MITVLTRIFKFYRNGFANMTWGRTLWFIIFIKLAIMFLILRIFFFQPTLQGNDKECANSVSKHLKQMHDE